MGTDLSAQAFSLLQAILLGAAYALLYDGLRAMRLLRRTHRAFTSLLDALYSLTLAVTLFAFALRVGNGELRLYMFFAILLGAVLSFSLLSPFLRPLWDFWAATLFDLARLLTLPLRTAKKYYGKLHKLAKKLFLFYRHTLIIENYRWSARRARHRAERREQICYGRTKQSRQKKGRRRLACKASSHHTASAHRRSFTESAKKD